MKTNITKSIKLKFRLIAAMLCASTSAAIAQDYSWVTHHSEPSDVRALDITTSPSGANYKLIEHSGTVTFGSTTIVGEGRALVRHNSAGTLSWALAASTIQVHGIKATDEHVYLAGTYQAGDFIGGHTFTTTFGSHDAFIIRLTSQGVVDLVITVSGTGYEDIRGLDVDKNGVMWVTGNGSESLVLGDSATDHPGTSYFMAGFDHQGKLTTLSRSSAYAGIKITTNSSSGRIFVAAITGEDQQSVNFSGETHTYTTQDFDSGDFFLVAYDNTGELISTKHHASTLKSTVATIDATENLDFYVTTEMLGELTARKYDKDLNTIWNIDISGNYPFPSGMCTDLIGNMYVAGRVPSKGFVFKYSADGKMLWFTLISPPENSSSDAEAVGIDTDHLGDVYITGHFNGTAEFENHNTYQSGGNNDFFVARIAGQSDYTSLAKHSAGSITVFPTICNGAFTIESAEPGDGQLFIRDVAGRIVYKTSVASKQQKLNVSLQDGVYFLEFQGRDNAMWNSRMVIMN